MKLPKVSRQELVALGQYQDNANGADPDMSNVRIATVLSLRKKGLIVSALDGNGKRRFKRESIPTELGNGVLAALTYGPKEIESK